MATLSLIVLFLFSVCMGAQEDEISRIGLAKDLFSLVRNPEGGYELIYHFAITNYGSTPLFELSLIDALRSVFPNPAAFTVIELTSTQFEVNENFDGTSNLELLGAGNELDSEASGTLELIVRVTPNSATASFDNSAMIYATDANGQKISDMSTSGTNADPDEDGDPTNNSQVTKARTSSLSLGGVVETTIFASETQSLTVDDFTFSAFATLGDFAVQLNASFTQFTSDTLNIKGSGALGNIRLNSSLAFNISAASFVSWQGGAAFSLLGIDFTDIAALTVPQTASYNQLSWSAPGDLVSVQGTLKTSISPFAFSAVNICATFDWPACDTSITGCVTFTADEGLSAATISLSDYTLFEDVLGVRGSLSATVSYTLEQKSLTPSLNLTPDWFICPEIDILAEFSISSSPVTVNSVLIYGIKGECPIGPATFRFAESLSPSKNSSVTGKAAYFERLGFSVDLPGCCGSPGKLSVDAYFEDTPSGKLFSWGLLTGSIELQLFDGFSFALDMQFAKDAPRWELSFNTKVFW